MKVKALFLGALVFSLLVSPASAAKILSVENVALGEPVKVRLETGTSYRIYTAEEPVYRKLPTLGIPITIILMERIFLFVSGLFLSMDSSSSNSFFIPSPVLALMLIT